MPYDPHAPRPEYEDGLPPPQPARHYLCRRARGPVVIDGDLTKPVWQDAPWTELFVDIEGDLRSQPRLATRAKLLWDDHALYVGAWLEEPDLWATLTERDSVIFHDNDFEVFLDPSCEGRNYYELEINALGTVWDLVLREPYRLGGTGDNSWDVKGLASAVKLFGSLNEPRDRDAGWSVELAFPFAAFDVHTSAPRAPRVGERWGLDFSRVQWDLEVADGRYRKIAGRKEHNWVWSPMGMIDMHLPLRWGTLEFVP